MDSKTVKLNFLTLGDLENEPISKKKWSVPLRLIFLFPHVSLLRNRSSIWALPYIKTFIRLPETILITF